MTAVPAVATVGPDGALSPPQAPVLAFDIGGTKVAAGVVSADGRAASFALEPTRAADGPAAVLPRLWALGRRVLAESGLEVETVGAVGIGCGGPLDAERGVLIAPPHLPGWRDVPVTALASEAFGVTAVLENDATAAAAAEHRYGAGIGTRHLVYLTISTGVGGGVVLDGRLYRGAMGNGGELGHITIDCEGRRCHGCGRQGCLEAYVSGTSIAERAQEAGLDGLDAAGVAAAARAGDPVAVQVWDETTTYLGCGLTSIVNLFEPELVVIGGGVSGAGEQLLGPAREQVRAQAMGPAREAARIVLSALGEQVGVIGAAAIAHDRAGAARSG